MKRFVACLVAFSLGAAATALVGWSLLNQAGNSATSTSAPGEAAPAQVWTCSMHPQIRMDHKDVCPLCGMELTPVDARQDPWEAEDPGARMVLGEQAQRMAGLETTEVLPRELFKELRTVGRVELDETNVAHISARVDGRVDQVYADFPGIVVRQGEHLVRIYSPELLSTQEEFLAALRAERGQPSAGQDRGLSLSNASRRRLLLWGITEQQIDELASSGQAQDHLTVYAPIGGTVIEKNIREGQYVKAGDSLYTVADLRRVWLVLDVYESEVSWVRLGQQVNVTLESEPNRPITGAVAFIEPVLTTASRTVRVRVLLENQESRLKPGMYAQAHLRIPILPDGQPAPAGPEGKYVCPMHPYEVSDKPGVCKQCQMPLELTPNLASSPDAAKSSPTLTPASSSAPASASGKPKVLAVPAEAVLTTGQRQLVYVEREAGNYQLVEPKLGPRAGDYYPVLSGLNERDRVVTRGNFLLDSQYQVTGRTSLLYPGGSTGSYAGPDASTGFTANEQANLDRLPSEDRELAARQEICPITGAKLGSMGKPFKLVLDGRTIFLCCPGCEGQAKADAAATLRKVEQSTGGLETSPSRAEPQGGSHG